jgi:transposase-like protein
MAHRSTKEFEEEAVRLFRTRGRAKREIADDPGVGRSTSTRWLARPGAGQRTGVLAQGLAHDLPAARAAITERWSTSLLEEQVGPLRTVQGQRSGRTGFDPLRERVLAAACSGRRE